MRNTSPIGPPAVLSPPPVAARRRPAAPFSYRASSALSPSATGNVRADFSLKEEPVCPLKKDQVQNKKIEFRVGIRLYDSNALCRFTALQQAHRHRGVSPDLLFRHWDKVQGALIAILGSRKKADMVLEGMRLEAVYGLAFASARHYAAYAGVTGTVWDRLCKHLRQQGWIEVRRLWRPNGTMSTNLISFRRLFAWAFALVRANLRGVRRVKGTTMVKVHHVWIPLLESVKHI